MLCSNCKKNTATMQIKTDTQGKKAEYFLCPLCAKKLGYASIDTDFSFDLDDFFGSVFSKQPLSYTQQQPIEQCDNCGATFDFLAKTGKAGCAECYKKFEKRLAPSIKQIHGNTSHTGKIPSSASEALRLKRAIFDLNEKLNIAVSRQEYEEAAKLRDEIKKLQNKD